MSRYKEQFEQHPFQGVWSELKNRLNNLKVDDETQITSVSEIARLKKVISYLDELITNIDPEMVPFHTWQSFQGQAQPCLQQVNAFIANKNIAHIQNANNHVDNLLSYIRPYMVLPQKILNGIKKASDAYAGLASDYVNSFKERADNLLNDIQTQQSKVSSLAKSADINNQKIQGFYDDVFANNNGIQSAINTFLKESKVDSEQIKQFHKELLIGDQKNDSIKKEVSQTQEYMQEKRNEATRLIEKTKSIIDDLSEFYTKTFGNLNEDGKPAGGLDKELETLKEHLQEFEDRQRVRYSALNDQIESLLPGATSAGLATAYREMRESFSNPIKNASWQFYTAIAVLAVVSLIFGVSSFQLWPFSINFVEIDSWHTLLRSIAHKLPFYLPVLWFAYYSTKRRSEAQRLQQEYAHKEALAKSYDSYKKQIEELGEESKTLLPGLIAKAIDAVAFNASSTLDGKHGEKMPVQEIIEAAVRDGLKVK